MGRKAETRLLLLSASLLLNTVTADWGDGRWGSSDGDRPDGWGPSWWNGDDDDDDDDDDNDNSGSGDISQAAIFTSEEAFGNANRILIIHAVLASLVWVMFIPSLAILLRLNLKNPIVLKLHAAGQILSYIIYIAAAGLGIWLCTQMSAYGIWDDAHPKLGLAILILAFFQPFLGAIHQRTFKKRVAAVADGKPSKPPGRTGWGRAHLWLGRLLIVLGIINGGLGIRLARTSPFQTDSQSRIAGIVYGVVAAFMFFLYLILVVIFEVKRDRYRRSEQEEISRSLEMTKETPPSYTESEESVVRGQQPPRYG